MSAARESRSLRDAAAVDRVGPGRFAAEISDDFTTAGHPNGGYLQCLLANAALAAASEEGSAHVHATAVTTNYVAAPNVGFLLRKPVPLDGFRSSTSSSSRTGR